MGGVAFPSQPPDADLTSIAAFGMSAFAGLLYGATLSNNGSDATNDIDIAAGKCIDSTNAVLMSLSALTKRLDANWAAGTNQGMRNSAAAIDNVTYHIYAVCKAAGADPDIYAHTSATVATVLTALQAETGGSAYVYARRIGSILRESAAIVAFTQVGDRFMRSVPTLDENNDNPGTSAVTIALKAPTGIAVEALITAGILDTTPAANTLMLVTALTQADTDPGSGAGYWSVRIQGAAGKAALPEAQDVAMSVMTDTSAQIRYRLHASTADTYAQVWTRGWIDTRGRLN